ncbi:MAG: NAD-dependent epimerase/dehydratase family protein [Sterolibacterium sp.]|nr:NAD-dependent epimerase/dehydratase family protein [Sterolibacterium sp.]
MTRILLIGANSFVGTNYINASRNKEVEEISLHDRRPEDIDFSLYDVVIHLVAIVHQSAKIDENQYYEINRDICLKAAECAKKAGVRQFIFLSTIKVYGEFILNSGPWHEDSLCSPNDPYGRSKYEAELGLQQMEDASFTVSIIRTPLVYGAGVKANMLNLMRLVDRLPILPLARVNNKRSFTSAENLAAFIDRIIEKKASGIFIAMDESSLSTTALVELISRYLEKKVLLFRIPDLLIRIGTLLIPTIFDRLYGSFEIDNRKTLLKINFKPPISIEEGIKKMVEEYKFNKLKKRYL